MKRGLDCFNYKYIYFCIDCYVYLSYQDKLGAGHWCSKGCLSHKFPFDILISLGYAVYNNESDGSSFAFIKRQDEECIGRRGFITEKPTYGLIIILYKNRRHYGVSQRKKENW